MTWKLTIGLAALITLLGLFIISVVYQLSSGVLRNQLDQRAVAIATNLSDAASANVVRKNVLELYGLVRKYALLDGVEYAFIDDATGEVIAHTFGTFPPELKETVSPEARLHTRRRELKLEGKRIYETSVPVLGGQVGSTHLGMREDFVDGEIRRAILPIIEIVAGIVIGGILICSGLVAMITRPIRRLGRAADTMSKGDLETPVILGTASRDEIGEIARSLERLRSSLKAAMSRFSDG